MSRRTFRVLLALVALSAAALRLWHVVADLPDFLEEAVPFRNALDLWSFTGGRTDWNPHLFHYPSLTVYLHYFVQRLGYLVGWMLGISRAPADWFISYLADPATVVVPARLLHVAADASAVLAAGLVGERLRRGAGVAAAVLVALTPTLIETSRFIFIETIMAALALWSLERMLAWREHGGAWRLGSAVALAGSPWEPSTRRSCSSYPSPGCSGNAVGRVVSRSGPRSWRWCSRCSSSPRPTRCSIPSRSAVTSRSCGISP